ncbi:MULTISPECIES: hypothetical protein [Sorangium]|uniref:Outer membrane lipoprotein BamD-like domain-containing protein n=1 Tax=Sorangium cellulosum TaxID=56 RepID=A0A4P2QN07_SORCE|nr:MULTISPECIES: hypothetical protein [Sorangium]AUX30903.1 hypothetical protein SOCE836_030170 [Sorangium cellulosum]WCQ90284.1 hypothetical protein NQZ70_02987 [Sorangium sp. Soce836]
MSDPKRWKQEGGGAPLGARELLLAASRPRPMTSAELARTAARVAPLATSAGAGATVPMWIKGIFLAVGLGAGGAGLYASLDDGRSAAAPVAPLTDLPLEQLFSSARGGLPTAAPPPAPEPAPAPAPAAEPAPVARREAPRNTRPAAPAPDAIAAADNDDLVRESNLVDQSRAALAQDPAAALAALARHEADFPRGRLAEEREFIAIRALMRLGRADEARARAAAFMARYPSSSFAEPVRRIVSAAP